MTFSRGQCYKFHADNPRVGALVRMTLTFGQMFQNEVGVWRSWWVEKEVQNNWQVWTGNVTGENSLESLQIPGNWD